jgi:hypothetical protein
MALTEITESFAGPAANVVITVSNTAFDVVAGDPIFVSNNFPGDISSFCMGTNPASGVFPNGVKLFDPSAPVVYVRHYTLQNLSGAGGSTFITPLEATTDQGWFGGIRFDGPADVLHPSFRWEHPTDGSTVVDYPEIVVPFGQWLATEYEVVNGSIVMRLLEAEGSLIVSHTFPLAAGDCVTRTQHTIVHYSVSIWTIIDTILWRYGTAVTTAPRLRLYPIYN